MIGFRWLSTFSLAAALVLTQGHTANAVEPGAPDRLIDREYMTLIALRDELNGDARKRLQLTQSVFEGVSEYYQAPDARLVWVNETGLDRDSLEQLRTAFARADRFGLDPREYSVADAETLTSGSQSMESLADAELRISAAALAYATHAQAGRVKPKSINRDFLDMTPDPPKPQVLLSGLAQSGDALADHLESFHPPHPQFKALQKKLLETKSAVRTGSRPKRIPDGPSLGPGTYHPQVATVRERLSVAPPLDAPDGRPDEYYDEALEEAVRAFQESREIRVDGIVGRNTRAALNEGTIPVSVNTILANMERWRWMPRDLGERYVFINVPEFKFQVISADRVIHQERIVAGSPKHPTPVFTDVMETVVFNPYWNVPRSILVNEIMPAARRNLDYIYRNNMEVIWRGSRTVDPYMVDWEYVDPNKLRLRQRPGPSNALGRVKFLFPNKHAVYMHDTPSKHLFNRPVRAYSHGCMRVRNPLEFAKLLLRDQGWTEGRIQRALAAGNNQHVPLEAKLPVHVSYFTAWVEEDGTLKGYRDIYGHDSSVRVALNLDSRKVLASNEQDFDIGEHGLRN